MSEYIEALSRLESPERPPNIRYIKRIPFGIYPDYTSTDNYIIKSYLKIDLVGYLSILYLRGFISVSQI